MRRRKCAQSLRFHLVDLGYNDLAYAAAIGRERLCAAQLDTFDDFNVFLMTEILNYVVHGLLGVRHCLTIRGGAHADEVTLTPPGRRCHHSAISAVCRFARGGSALHPRVLPRCIVAGLARLLDRSGGPLIFILSHRTLLHSGWLCRRLAAARRAPSSELLARSRHPPRHTVGS